MSIKLTILEQMEEVAREHGKILAPLKDDLVLAECGLDSLGFAVLVARLEDTLGVDPFTAAEEAVFPVTLGDFVKGSTRMACTDARSLRDHVANAPQAAFFFDHAADVQFTALDRGTSLGGRLGEFDGRSVLVATASQLTAALALIELDGRARRITILPPDAETDHLPALIAAAEIDAVVLDSGSPRHPALDLPVRAACVPSIAPLEQMPAPHLRTEWVLLTSGTTGVPKMVVHDLSALTAAVAAKSAADGAAVWGTFYDIRRYGGLQIFLRAVLAAPRSSFRAPASRSPIIWRGLRTAASPTFPARRRIGGAR